MQGGCVSPCGLFFLQLGLLQCLRALDYARSLRKQGLRHGWVVTMQVWAWQAQTCMTVGPQLQGLGRGKHVFPGKL
jgi:hypothetical protein